MFQKIRKKNTQGVKIKVIFQIRRYIYKKIWGLKKTLLLHITLNLEEEMNQKYFVDHYEALQVSPNADLETLERIYRLFAKRYHPDNSISGNVEKFNIITEAYRLLSDPEKRAAYDVKYDEEKIHQNRALLNQSASDAAGNEQHIRNQILSILYVEKRRNPSESGVGLWTLENWLGLPEKVLQFHIWYLIEKEMIQRSESGGYAITAIGVDVVEQNDLILKSDRLLPETDESCSKKDCQKDNNVKRKHIVQSLNYA